MANRGGAVGLFATRSTGRVSARMRYCSCSSSIVFRKVLDRSLAERWDAGSVAARTAFVKAGFGPAVPVTGMSIAQAEHSHALFVD